MHVKVSQGAKGRWRFTITEVTDAGELGKVLAVSPVRGFETKQEASDAGCKLIRLYEMSEMSELRRSKNNWFWAAIWGWALWLLAISLLIGGMLQ